VTQSKEIHWISIPLPDGAPPDETVWISVAKFEASWKKNRAQYIGPGGSGPAIGDRYEKFGAWLEQGEAVEIPWVGLEHGEIAFTNGRHRYAWLRDLGVKSIPVDVDPAIADEIRSRFGTEEQTSSYRYAN
jgi:hypothetical protein